MITHFTNSITRKGFRFIKRIYHRYIHTRESLLAKKHPYISLISYLTHSPKRGDIINVEIENLVYTTTNDSTVSDNSALLPAGQIVTKIVLLKDATCFAYSDIILLPTGAVIYDMKESDWMKRGGDFKDDVIIKDANHWCKLTSIRNEVLIPNGIKIGGMFGFNYYHFIFQLLPKLFLTKDINQSIPILLDRSAQNIDSMKQLVEWCNFQNREVIYMDYDTAYKVKELYIITTPNTCIPNLKQHFIPSPFIAAYSPKYIRTLRDNLLPHSVRPHIGKRIFIYRGKNSSRRRYNEDECFAAIEVLGFEKVAPQEMTMAEQIGLFSQAEIIIAASGAALSNLLFISPNCKVIILSSTPLLNNLWSTLIVLASSQAYFISDSTKDETNLNIQQNFKIDAESLYQVTKSLCNEKIKHR